MSLHREKCQVQASLIFDMLRFLATFQFSCSVQQVCTARHWLEYNKSTILDGSRLQKILVFN